MSYQQALSTAGLQTLEQQCKKEMCHRFAVGLQEPAHHVTGVAKQRPLRPTELTQLLQTVSSAGQNNEIPVQANFIFYEPY